MGFGRSLKTTDDRDVGSYLKSIALLEIRAMARRKKPLRDWPDDDYVACIAWLADLCHTMPGYPVRGGGVARGERPFSHAWAVADARGRKWILESLDSAGMPWVPPAASQ